MKFIDVCGSILAGLWIGFVTVFCNAIFADMAVEHFNGLGSHGQIGIAWLIQLALFSLLAVCIHQAGILKKRRSIIRAVAKADGGKAILKDLDFNLREDARNLTR